MAQGASMEAREMSGFTALIWASKRGKTEIIEVCFIFWPLRSHKSGIEKFYFASVLCDLKSRFQLVILCYSYWIALFVFES